ncbi:uncharacterized protein RSE6_00319 [Rhynchosporium secalis]|uniref:Uncharacterized protein n=1 Tax=Rhynchosporium secalis TaxID=38038 RepID=A0A1E1LV23_RHYSE|nr:uncharacterized protein RSE6_00319 [Rhynchosporium secalis]
MAHGGRHKPPLDVLQSMINAILIETGKALRPSSKDGKRAVANVNTRLRTIIPSAVDNFHMALDDLECDIIRAKSVLLRDLDELRAKRIALENPVPILEEVVEETPTATNTTNGNTMLGSELHTSPQEAIKEERSTRSPENRRENETQSPPPDLLAEAKSKPIEDVNPPLQDLAPPAPSNETSLESKPIGLGITNEGAPAIHAGNLQNSSVDSPFEIAENETNDSALNFDDIDFSLDTSTNIQDPSQSQSNDLDLSNFGNTNPMPNNTITNANANANSETKSKPVDDLFDFPQDIGTGDAMDLDMGMAGAEDSVFDDMFFGGGEDEGASGGGEIQHGEFDNAFFGLE